MGMFDWIECELPLPVKGEGFQTKNLECWLYRYVIDSKGFLWRGGTDVEDNNPREVEKNRVPFDGDIRFYTSLEPDPNAAFVS